MELVKYVFLVILFGVVISEDQTVEDENSEDNNREVREFNAEGWRAVETFPDGDLGWIPREEIKDTDQIIVKRRRIRKRKRRPPQENLEGAETPFPRRRIIRPYRLQQIAQPWEEMTEETIKPNNRRRIPLPYQPIEETDKGDEGIKGTHRKDIEEKPLVASIIVDDKPEPQMMQNSLTDLKNLLKQSGGKFSLSEILQQNNLSLAELLKGNEKAISALTEAPKKTQPVTEPTTPTSEHPNKYKRLPPSQVLKTTSRTSSLEDPPEEILTEKETVEAQKKRQNLLQRKENKIFANVIKFDVVTEATTERRIFIPSNKYEGEINTTTERKTTITSTTTTEKPTTTTNPTTKASRFRKKLPTTNAKLRITTKKVNLMEKERYPTTQELPKPIKIDINEILSLNKKEDIILVNEEKPDGPMKISIDLETMFNKINKTNVETVSISELTTNSNNSEDQNETYVTAQQEIMEVMKDPASRQKLSRILEFRNMTLEELVKQRERGSSQLHLADIFHNKTREPEPKDEPFVGEISPDFFQNMRGTNRQQKSTKFDELTKSSSTEEPTVAMKTATSKQKEAYPTVSVEINKNVESADTFPWKQLYPDLFPKVNSEENEEIIQRIDLESSLTSIPDEGFFSSMPSGVKSAIFVSLAIIGLSIAVFLAILVVFKWAQRKNKSINYCSSLTTKFRSPIMLQGRPTTAIKTFMNETLGRKKNYYKTSLQSMSDEIWDANKDRKESF